MCSHVFFVGSHMFFVGSRVFFVGSHEFFINFVDGVMKRFHIGR